MRRVCLWRGAYTPATQGWAIDAPKILVRHQETGQCRYLHEFDIQDMWPLVLAHSDHARLRDWHAAQKRDGQS
jgi:hypothetical protein